MVKMLLERAYQPISVDPVLDSTRLEIRIHGEKPQGDQPAFLTVHEARILAYGLLAEAERLTSNLSPSA